MTTTMTIFRDLPNDLVEEILCYVPATYLKRLKSTSRGWNRLFNGDSRFFAREHTAKAAKQFLVLLVKEYRICPTIFNLLDGSVEFKSELSLVDPQDRYLGQFDIVAAFHCDGLLLCTSEWSSRLMVWNPFTGDTRWFRLSKTAVKLRRYVLGYYQEDNDKRYKILSFELNYKEYEIYELSSDSWRTLDDIAPGWSIEVSDVRVSLNRNTYWFAADETKAQSNISLLKFDFQTEKSVPLPLPYECDYFESRGLSVVREEKLSVLLQRDVTSKTEIWVTNKIDDTTTPQVVSWSKVLALDLCPELQIGDDVNFLLDEEKKVVMMCLRWLDWEDETKRKNMLYTVGEDGEVTQVVLGTDERSATSILNYVPSLVQIEQAGRKRKRANISKM